MKEKITHFVYSLLICCFWLGIYAFNSSILAACMASIFGSFGLISLGQVAMTVGKRVTNEYNITPISDKTTSSTLVKS